MIGQELGHIHFEILQQSVFKHSYLSNQWQEPFHSWNIIISKHYPPHFYSILFNPITLEGFRDTTDELATIPYRKTLRWGKTRDSLKDCTSHCSSYKLKPMWRDNKISLESKVKLMRSLAISIFLYTCESLPLTAKLEKRTQAFEMKSKTIEHFVQGPFFQ